MNKLIPTTRNRCRPKLWARTRGRGLMRRLVYWKPLMVSKHRDGMSTMGSRTVRTPVCTG